MLRPGGLYEEYSVLESYIFNCKSIKPTFLVTRVFFLSNGVHYACVSCEHAWQWAWETGLYVDGGVAVRKLRKVKLAGTTKKQDGYSYLKILQVDSNSVAFH